MRQFKMNKLSRPYLTTSALAFLVTLYIVLIGNRLFWRSFAERLGLDTFGHGLFFLTVGIAFVLLLNGLISLFAFRPVFKPLLIMLLLTAAAISYFSDTFGVVIDRSMIQNILETDVGEASELLTAPLATHLLLYGLVPAALVALTRIRYHSRKKELLTRAGVMLGSLAVLVGLGLFSYKEFVLFGRENRDLQIFLNPSYAIYSLERVIEKEYFSRSKAPLRAVATDAVRKESNSRSVVVLALGETARAQQFAFNGYPRDTNPELARHGVIDFSDVQSCGTSTAESLPCIFSALARENYSRGKAGGQENLLDILQRTGVTVLWRDNDGGSKGVADRVPFENVSRQTDAELCDSNNCFDEILLRDLDRKLAETSGDMLIVLHMKGSHGPSYYKRTPPAFKAFAPECTMDNIQDCPQQAIVNAYDNTIVYTDHVLAELVNLLKRQSFPAAMLYVSDHGESLGENGLYLHGLPYALAPAEQTQVPMIFWASDSFAAEKSLDIAALAARRQKPYSHDFVFHSVLGLFDVQSKTYRPDLDFFAAARTRSIVSQRD